MAIDRWDKIETYKVVRQLKAEHLIDVKTYASVLNGLGISENEKRTLLYEGDQTINITLV